MDPDHISQKISEIHSHYEQYGISGLAQAYEDFKREVVNAETAAYKGEAGGMVLQRIKDLENLFSTVTGHDVRELSMFMKDSEALKRTAKFASVNAEHIRFGDLGGTLAVSDFVHAARHFMNPDFAVGSGPLAPEAAPQQLETFNSLNWAKLGAWYYAKTNVPLPSHFLYGPLATKRRQAAPRARNVDDTNNGAAKVTPQKVSAAELHDDPEQSTSHMVRMVYGVLSEKAGADRVNLFRFFINPASFAQSVENLFYTSFLVRDGKLKLDTDAGVPYVQISSDEPDDSDAQISHHIATLDVHTWQALIQQHSIEDSYIPHRQNDDDVISDDDSSDDDARDDHASDDVT